jgi:glycosyltransferase involved in cell wall biosynthesis
VKILRVISRLNVGGPARHVVVLDGGLRARGHDTLLLHGTVGEHEGTLEHLATESALPAVRIPALGRRVSPLSDLRAFAVVLRTIFREAPDVVHTHTTKAGVIGRVSGVLFNATRPRSRRCVIVHTFHGHVLEGYFSSPVNRLVRVTERWLGRVTDRIVAISPGQREDLVSRYRVAPAARTVVVPLGLDLRYLQDDAAHSLRSTLGVDEHAIVFGFVGRMVPIKDLPTLVRAFALVLTTLPQCVLVIAGDGPSRPELERLLAETATASHARLLGWREDLGAVYATMDICVLSSRNEGTPVAVIEAMAAGRPVVSTRVGGVPDIVEDNQSGLLVAPGDAGALAAAMGRLARDADLRSRLGARGRDLALARFGHERLVEEIGRLYASALREKRG